MKKLLLLAMMFCAVFAVSAEETKWETNFEVAKKLSKESKKPLLVLFTGSDWCRWCKKLEKNILSTEKFKEFAKDKVVFLYLDFPDKKKMPLNERMQNRKLAEKYNVEGYPSLLVISPTGKTGKAFGIDSSSWETFSKKVNEEIEKVK